MANIKEKVLNFGQSIGLSKAEIARQLGISKSNFVGDVMSSELNSSVVIKFCRLYPEVSAEWLLRDEGPMLRSMGDEVPTETNVNNGVNNGHIGSEHNTMPADIPSASFPAYCDTKTCELLKAKDDVIEAQRITIEALRGATKGN